MSRAPPLRHVATTIRRASQARPTRARPRQTPKPPQPDPNHAAPLLSPPPPPPPSHPPPLRASYSRWQAPALLGAALTAGLMGFWAVQLGRAILEPCRDADAALLSSQPDVSARFDATAASFDADVALSEFLMGVHRLRRALLRPPRCHGHVLEVSCGTGRNAAYYDVGPASAVDSLTFVDLSPAMVAQCKRKWRALRPRAVKPGLPVRFLASSALDPLPPPPGARKYDTIVQTMGLCSTPAPAALLANLARHLDTASPDARILLLEHGRSYLPWLNRVLDNAAPAHARRHGCWNNRDVGALVAEAAEKHGLTVVAERRLHLGTTWVFELRPALLAED